MVSVNISRVMCNCNLLVWSFLITYVRDKPWRTLFSYSLKLITDCEMDYWYSRVKDLPVGLFVSLNKRLLYYRATASPPRLTSGNLLHQLRCFANQSIRSLRSLQM